MPRVTIGPLSLELPGPNWTLSTIVLSGPAVEGQSFRKNLVIATEVVPPETTPQAYLDRQSQGLDQAGLEQPVQEEPELVRTTSGQEGRLLERVVINEPGQWCRQLHLTLLLDGVGYTLVATELDGEAFDAVRDEFRHLLQSFSLA